MKLQVGQMLIKFMKNITIILKGKGKHFLVFLIGVILIITSSGCNFWQDFFSNNDSDENQTNAITHTVTEVTLQANQPESTPSETVSAGEDDEATQNPSKAQTATPTRTSDPTKTEEISGDPATITPSKTRIPSSKTPSATNTRFFFTPTYTPSNTALPPTESPTSTTTPEPTDTPCPPT